MSTIVSDVTVGSVVLDVVGTTVGLPVTDRVTGGTLERTMDGASTLAIVIEDADRALLRSGIFNTQIDVSFDGEWWRSVQVSKQGDEITVTFEDRAVSLLRLNTTPKKASRSEMTRAQFIQSMIQEVKTGGGIPFVCPELTTVQPIAQTSDEKTAEQKTADRDPGIASGKKLYARDANGNRYLADAEQIKNAEKVIDVARSLGAGERATLALIEACMIETNLRNRSDGDRDSRGILQVRDSTARSFNPPFDNMDVAACANRFLVDGFYTDPELGSGGAIVKAAKFPDKTTGRIAQATQGSAYPSRYDKAEPEAKAFLDAYGGSDAVAPGNAGVKAGGGKVLTQKQLRAQPFQFQRGGTDGKPEDSWTCIQRLADDVQWRAFMSDGVFVFASEPTLMTAQPRATLSEQSTGVFAIDFDVDNGKLDSTATLTVRALRHGFPPGSVVQLEDCGPADGRWLVQTVRRGIFDPEASIDLKRPTAALPEPSSDTAAGGSTVSASDGGALAIAGKKVGLSGKVARAWQAAQSMSAKRYPYVWGGGHARAGVPDHGVSGHADSAGTIAVEAVGFDCSGSTVAVLASAGMGFELNGATDDSGGIADHWGSAGEGAQLTVWANDKHVFMVFHTKDGDRHFGTGDFGKGWDGPGFNSRLHDTGGFTARHWHEEDS